MFPWPMRIRSAAFVFSAAALSADAAFPARRLRPGGSPNRAASPHDGARRRSLASTCLWQTAVTGISADGVHLGGSHGSRSLDCWCRWRRIRACGAGLDSIAVRAPSLRYAFRRHYRVAPWTDHMEVYWGERCQGYATAVSREQVCVALASHDSKPAAGGRAAGVARTAERDWRALRWCPPKEERSLAIANSGACGAAMLR